MMMTNTRKSENCGLSNQKQGYQLCKFDAASFKMMCDVEHADTEQALVSLLDFRLPEIVQPKTKFQVVLK